MTSDEEKQFTFRPRSSRVFAVREGSRGMTLAHDPSDGIKSLISIYLTRIFVLGVFLYGNIKPTYWKNENTGQPPPPASLPRHAGMLNYIIYFVNLLLNNPYSGDNIYLYGVNKTNCEQVNL